MKKFLLIALILIIAQQILFTYQTRNVNKVSPEQMYQIALEKNGVRNGK